MAINSETISSETISSQVIESNSIGSGTGLTLTNRALCILNDTETTQVFSEGTWNLLMNSPSTRDPIVNTSAVVTGWTITNTTYSENGLSLVALPFYDAGVYAIVRCVQSTGTVFTLTISGLNNSAKYTFLFSGATSSSTGAGTRVMTITSSVSGDTATVMSDPADSNAAHLGTVPLQTPSSGTIVLTLTNTGPTQQVQISTFEIQQFS